MINLRILSTILSTILPHIPSGVSPEFPSLIVPGIIFRDSSKYLSGFPSKIQSVNLTWIFFILSETSSATSHTIPQLFRPEFHFGIFASIFVESLSRFFQGSRLRLFRNFPWGLLMITSGNRPEVLEFVPGFLPGFIFGFLLKFFEGFLPWLLLIFLLGFFSWACLLFDYISLWNFVVLDHPSIRQNIGQNTSFFH